MFTLWFTGLPCSGKSTLSSSFSNYLTSKGYISCLLDADVIRKGLNSDLGYSDRDRTENIRRLAELAVFLQKMGYIVLVSAITPTEEDRWIAKKIHEREGVVYRQVYVKCSLKECEKRDVKGMYKRARNGEIKEFTGVDSVYEVPRNSDLVVDTETRDIEECVKSIVNYHLKWKW